MNDGNLKPLIIIGGGGHAGVLVDILRSQQRNILAIACPDDIKHRSIFVGIKHLTNDEDILNYPAADVLLVNGIGMMPRSKFKRKVNDHFVSLGYHFESVIASSAIISNYARLGEGAQILTGAIIQAGAIIGEHSIINSRVVIEHDADVGRYNHIAPGAVLCGQVLTEEDVFIGAGATVIQNIVVAKQAFVAAGAIVTTNIPASSICYPSRVTILKGDL